MKRQKRMTTAVSIPMPAEMAQAIRVAADQTGQTVAGMVRAMIADVYRAEIAQAREKLEEEQDRVTGARQGWLIPPHMAAARQQ